MPPRVLIVDDDAALADTVREVLEADGLAATIVGGADAALAALGADPFDLIVLDVVLPGFSGVELCRRLKASEGTARVPVLLLTSRSREQDKVLGLDAGADDYVTKPFSVLELAARVRALLRRARADGALEPVWRGKDIALDEQTRVVTVQGRRVELRPKEFELLALFLKKRGRVLAKRFLAEAVWGPDALATSHTLSVSIAGLRRKLGSLGRRIQAVTGVGYKYDED